MHFTASQRFVMVQLFTIVLLQKWILNYQAKHNKFILVLNLKQSSVLPTNYFAHTYIVLHSFLYNIISQEEHIQYGPVSLSFSFSNQPFRLNDRITTRSVDLKLNSWPHHLKSFRIHRRVYVTRYTIYSRMYHVGYQII